MIAESEFSLLNYVEPKLGLKLGHETGHFITNKCHSFWMVGRIKTAIIHIVRAKINDCGHFTI